MKIRAKTRKQNGGYKQQTRIPKLERFHGLHLFYLSGLFPIYLENCFKFLMNAMNIWWWHFIHMHFFFKIHLFILDRGWGKGQRERNFKPTPHWAQNQTWAQFHDPWDHDWGRSQSDGWMPNPGALYMHYFNRDELSSIVEMTLNYILELSHLAEQYLSKIIVLWSWSSKKCPGFLFIVLVPG